jgi:hypothetical protein
MPNPVRKEHTAPGGATRLRIATLAAPNPSGSS